MALSKHPNILRVRGEWIEGTKLYIACRYMSPGQSSLSSEYYIWLTSIGHQGLSSISLDMPILMDLTKSLSPPYFTRLSRDSSICIKTAGFIGM